MQKKLVFAIFLLKFVSSETNDLKLVFADFMRNQVFQNPDEHKAYFEGSKIVGCQGQNLSYDEFAHEITDKMDRRLGFNITLSSINFQNPAEILKQTINVIYRNSGSLISEVKATCEIIN
ncbi:unnamed protein product [Caenorhabditis angaria]|uniref:SPK domain-containing protein n=1 Tax=Caenorhabditis angaria TaxID=860376 RepID=A0A9P1MZ61_9PELO|nr:unnamed protein product [Caenorhabditis angaria]